MKIKYLYWKWCQNNIFDDSWLIIVYCFNMAVWWQNCRWCSTYSSRLGWVVWLGKYKAQHLVSVIDLKIMALSRVLKAQFSDFLLFRGRPNFAYINPMITTCRLVKMNIWSYIEPITECVRKNSLISKFLMLFYQICFNDWLNKWPYHDINQSYVVLEGH